MDSGGPLARDPHYCFGNLTSSESVETMRRQGNGNLQTAAPRRRKLIAPDWRDRCPIYLALLKSQSIALTTA
jgi:hypothetical protein